MPRRCFEISPCHTSTLPMVGAAPTFGKRFKLMAAIVFVDSDQEVLNNYHSAFDKLLRRS
jgi:hypothetical protein